MRRLLILPALLLAGCTMTREIDNGPVGPERNEVRVVWPWSVCSEAPQAPVKTWEISK